MEQNEKTPLDREAEPASGPVPAENGEHSVSAEEYRRLKEEFEAFREHTRQENAARVRREELKTALRKAGARQETMIDLLLCAPEAEQGSTEEALRNLMGRYAMCFTGPAARGMEPLSPPRSNPEEDPDDLSDEEYYRRSIH